MTPEPDELTERLSFIPDDVLLMEAVPAYYVRELVSLVWPGIRFISRKPTNHAAQLYNMTSCEVIGQWPSNTKAFRYLWDLADRGQGLPSIGGSLGVGPSSEEYRKAKIQSLTRDMSSLLQEMYEWTEDGEVIVINQIGPDKIESAVKIREHYDNRNI